MLRHKEINKSNSFVFMGFGAKPNVVNLRKEPLSCCRFPLTGATIVELKAQKIKDFKSPLIGGLDKVKSLDFSLFYTE